MQPTSSTSASTNRLDSIDALRGIAALMVALYHIWGKDGTYPFPSIGVVPQTFDAPFYSYLISPARWGYLGVSLFLVLSGFCIHLAYAKRNAETGSYAFAPREFFLRRIWRLYPAYIIAILGTALLLNLAVLLPSINVAAALEIPTLRDVFMHLFMLHGFEEQTFYSIASVFWSLALEFQLYLAYPLFLILFRKMGIGRAITLLVAISIVWRAVSIHVFGYGLISIASTGPYVAMGTLIARMPEWLIGAWIAELYVSGALSRISKRVVGFASAITLAIAVSTTLIVEAWSLTDPLFGLAFGMLVVVGIQMSEQKQATPQGVVYRRLVWIGTISYSLYLFHLQFFWLIAPFIDKLPSPEIKFLLRVMWLGLTIGVIAILFRYFERPFLRLAKPGERYYSVLRMLRKSLGIKSDSLPDVALSKGAQ